jgi:hypothetical protein
MENVVQLTVSDVKRTFLYNEAFKYRGRPQASVIGTRSFSDTLSPSGLVSET